MLRRPPSYCLNISSLTNAEFADVLEKKHLFQNTCAEETHVTPCNLQGRSQICGRGCQPKKFVFCFCFGLAVLLFIFPNVVTRGFQE
jgi:hypothetical protein